MPWTSNRQRALKVQLGQAAFVPSVRRSKFEDGLETQLREEGIPYTYEEVKISYVVPERTGVYTPDFKIGVSILIEGKGSFQFNGDKGSAKERQKMILVKQQHPHLDIRFIFQNSRQAIYKGSKTTMAMWADTHGFPWAEKRIPREWLTEARKQLKEAEANKESIEWASSISVTASESLATKSAAASIRPSSSKGASALLRAKSPADTFESQ